MKEITLDTMTKVGKKAQIANREYTICPINIEDMGIVMKGEIYIPTEKQLENKEVTIEFFGLNVTEESRAEKFFYVVEKYTRYEGQPVTKDLVIEHNWSFKDIKDFLYNWVQISE